MNENLVVKSTRKKIKFWYLIFASAMLIWIILIVIAPVLFQMGGAYSYFATIIYKFFSVTCHQIDNRCFHVAGFKLAVCSRCFSIYLGIFFSLMLYPFIFTLNKIKIPDPLVFIVPAAFMAGDYFLDVFGILKNTMLTRSITGFLFGSGLALFLLPTMLFFINEVHEYFKNKKVHI
jgi:uncharacterized membrane protein